MMKMDRPEGEERSREHRAVKAAALPETFKAIQLSGARKEMELTMLLSAISGPCMYYEPV